MFNILADSIIYPHISYAINITDDEIPIVHKVGGNLDTLTNIKVLLSKTKFCNHVCLHSTVDSCNALYRIVYKFSLYLSTIPIPLTKNLFRLNLKNLSYGTRILKRNCMKSPKELGNKQNLVPGKYFDKTILVVITLYIKISRAETIYLNIPKQCIFIFSYKGLTKFNYLVTPGYTYGSIIYQTVRKSQSPLSIC
ncbi:unnamed protein product [Rhizophagus irregularis]|nr:unnamed protein product [Rhizophagus irregularis]CAB5386970.1 unnamed protein product [Rhizophagus irregularis]